ncbi:NAD(P)-binding protein [Halobacillus litoralis]|uniref:precorrin-2 dehydrogenase n=1 Tax=Halobacillus litoralis TaxID=45668 RepID=A0A845FAL8_9BACI|nr:NAD(P)-binding protein [Halobacillus litoralis]MYL70929.1 NAD(P)-binding protein [Halobacillus litoralis]
MISLSVDVEQKKVIIIGGGKAAEKRAKVFLREKAKITVVSPAVTEDLKEMIKKKEIHWLNRHFENGDVTSAFLLVIATDDCETNDNIALQAGNVPLVNRVDGGKGGNFYLPAQFTRGKLNVSVTTQGASPKLAGRLREEWEKQFPPAYKDYVDFLYECRQMLKASPLSKVEKEMYLERMLDPSYLEREKQWVIKEEIHTKGGGSLCRD